VGSEHDALELIAVTLTAVDEMTDVPEDPSKWMTLAATFSFARLVATGGIYGIANSTIGAAAS
jgi:hypothetical protein